MVPFLFGQKNWLLSRQRAHPRHPGQAQRAETRALVARLPHLADGLKPGFAAVATTTPAGRGRPVRTGDGKGVDVSLRDPAPHPGPLPSGEGKSWQVGAGDVLTGFFFKQPHLRRAERSVSKDGLRTNDVFRRSNERLHVTGMTPQTHCEAEDQGRCCPPLTSACSRAVRLRRSHRQWRRLSERRRARCWSVSALRPRARALPPRRSDRLPMIPAGCRAGP